MTTTVQLGPRKLNLTNLEKVLYPSGFTKAQVIDFYLKIAPILLPHLKDRHLTLKRYPNGSTGMHFFEKQCPDHRPPWIKTAGVLTSKHERTIDYCVVEDKPSLLWIANLAAIELHTPLSKASDPDHATSMVFDLDPGPGTDIVDCAKLGLKLRDILLRLKLKSFPKTSGGKGLHVWVPLNTRPTFDQTKTFANAIATIFAKENPRQVTAIIAKSERPGKIFIDWSQNDRGKTTVCAYSLRAKDQPSVSTPVTWDEVDQAVARRSPRLLTFLAEDVLARVEEEGDLFKPVLTTKQRLPMM
ncbi:MAG TPA: non-homologous end-joining DNA ligase [Tepidisphaeraceae bacterium]